MNKDLLLSSEEYKNIGKHEVPYVYTISKNGKVLYYFGSSHSFDPLHPQFSKLKDFFNDFLKHSDPDKRVVFIEGGVPDKLRKNVEESIISGGEMQYVDYLAKKEGVSVFSPEFAPRELSKELMKRYPVDEVAYYFFVRTYMQYLRVQHNPDFDSYMNIFLLKNMDEAVVMPYLFPNSLIPQIHIRLFSKDFDLADKEFFSRIVNPNHKDTVINNISQSTSQLRDIHILEQIEKEWEKGNSIFIIYGGTHAVMQEPALKSLLQ